MYVCVSVRASVYGLTAVVDFVGENRINRNGKPAMLVHQESLYIQYVVTHIL